MVDADPDAPQPWMASAYIEGPTLRAEVDRRGGLSEGELWRLAAVLAEALRAIHGHGLVHRDLKPDNIVLASDGPRVLDFGVARALDESRLTTDEPPARTVRSQSRTARSQPSTVTAKNPSPPLAVYLVRRRVWFLQILRNVLGVAGLVTGAVLSGTDAFPAAVPVTSGVVAAFLAVWFLGLLGTAKDGLTLNSRGIALGPPNNLVVMPWHDIKALELTRHAEWTDLTVHLDVVRRLPTGSHHPTWVRSGRNSIMRIRARRLTPLGTTPQLADAVHAFARWRGIRVNEG
ncbi:MULTISPECIES: phosphotransferase [unclassified Streptomyces]|uniref:protein kinase domain-containing protein n=1 Tax=unclassified Streptomyces TaxID=2593676 RepID=UPI0029C0F0C6|nr:phosphotransferase [Streptomyces sp. DK15]